jgi:fructan beta-fructosidase
MNSIKIFIVATLAFLIQSCSNNTSLELAMTDPNIVPDTSETYRPQFHYTPKANWMNDPNGMFYKDGKYHLYYQYYPKGNQWGPMHWGHSSTVDLLNWIEHDIAIYPDSALGYIFSGSAVIDSNNVSGLGTKQNPPLIAMYTHHQGETEEQYQSISYSLDGGMTFTPYENNPVISNPGIKHFRDPKIVWDGQQWISVMTTGQAVAFYASSDLIQWEKLSEFEHNLGSKTGVWECPELLFFNDDYQKAVLIVSVGDLAPNEGSGTQYFTGSWNGSKFSTNQKELKWLDYGRDNYAGVTWHNAPTQTNEKLFIGWMSNWKYATKVPTYLWRSSMTLPRLIECVKHGEHDYLQQKPHPNVKDLRKEQRPIQKISTLKGINTMEWLFDGSENWSIDFTNDSGDTLKIYSHSDSIYIDRSSSGITDFEESFELIQKASKKNTADQSVRLIMDVMSVELFCEGGLTTMTSLMFPKEKYTVALTQGIEGTIYSLAR